MERQTVIPAISRTNDTIQHSYVMAKPLAIRAQWHIEVMGLGNIIALRLLAERRHVLGPCTGLKFRPRPGPQIWFEAQARPGHAAVGQTRPWPGPQTELWGPGPARPAKSITQTRPSPQHNCHIWGPGPARARGHRAGPMADHIPQKQQYYYCTHCIRFSLYTHSNVTD